MLVLSRRAQQQVVFPHLGIKVSILQVRGRIVKIGIDAPDSVKVMRDEVFESDEYSDIAYKKSNDVRFASAPQAESRESSEAEHRRRNEMNVLQLRLEAIQRRLERGDVIDAESTLQSLLGKVNSFDHELCSEQHSTVPTSGTGEPIRLLVVEDSDNERNLMAFVLASHGFDVHVARDGAEALEQLRMWGSMPDFVLMDMEMPLSNGVETLHRIRHDERLANLKVFAVTGSKRVVENEPAGRSWDGWFTKPFDVSRLIQRLREESLSSHQAPAI